MSPSYQSDYRQLFVGLDVETPLLNGSRKKYVNLDNAASTPSFKSVQQAVDDFLLFYSSVHRGTGFKSQVSTHAYEQARQIALNFVGASPEQHTCIFGKNTTEAVNKLSRRFPFSPSRNIVLTSGMEHHSNDLPWRASAQVVHVRLTPEGRLDEDDFDRQLSHYSQRVALVAISGASNVTGFINPIHRLAEKAHRHGAQILVDAAQLAPHRPIRMLSLDDTQHLDYLAISAHKLYAPFGAGCLIGRRDTFESGEPDQRGGGTVEIVTLEDVVWADPPDREEAGSPNTVGAIAMAAAMNQLDVVGMDAVGEHEASLTACALRRLRDLPDVRLFGELDPKKASERLGVIPLGLEGISHFLVAAILGYEFGIGVRSGCFCAHPYILHLLQLSQAEARQVRNRMLAGDKSEMPGLIRVSFGLYNTEDEIDLLIEALERIIHRDYAGRYLQDISSGEFQPEGYQPDLESYFSISDYSTTRLTTTRLPD